MADTSRERGRAGALASALDRLTAAGAWLVLPLALLLFAQWPLRDLVGAWSRDANDAAQWIFALYVALALRTATRARAHMAAGLARHGSAGPWRRWIDRAGEAVCVLPWALFVLVAGAAPTWRSVVGLEAFPDTFNPLYFIVRASAWLLALGVAVQAVLDLWLAIERRGAPPPP
jgi:TRAP-type C4-dicarboxylate transport system permease small subunit